MICEKFAAEGCNVAVNYVSSVDRANQTAEKIIAEHHIKAVVIQGVGATNAKITPMAQ